jgi:hypothetical protein
VSWWQVALIALGSLIAGVVIGAGIVVALALKDESDGRQHDG